MVLEIILAIVLGSIFTWICAAKKASKNLKLKNSENLQLLKNIKELEESHNKLDKELAILTADKKAREEVYQNHKNEWKTLEDKFQQELKTYREMAQGQFESLAQKVFNANSEKLKLESKESLSVIIDPLKENLNHFHRELGERLSKQNESRIRLEEEIKRLVSINKSLSSDANNLATALKGDVKAQGQWGEMVLEKVLESSGLEEGRDYTREGKGHELKDQSGRIQRPDVIINLPDNKHLIIDSKVTLNSYNAALSSENEESKNKYTKDFLQAIRQHIELLSAKKYEALENLTTPEFVMMFIPIEGAFSLALQNEVNLFEIAWRKRIILVGPTNLLATLKAVESVWRQDKQEQNALKIAEQGGLLYDKFVGLVSDLEDINKHLGKSADSYQSAINKLSTGRGNLLGQVEKMKSLGAKAKKSLPQHFLETAQPEDLQLEN